MLTAEEQATNFATMRHIERVRNLLNVVVVDLLERGEKHDQSKLDHPEVELFAKYTAVLSGMTYGSDAYNQAKREMQPALDHHYTNNRHHPEHFPWHCPVCKGQYDAGAWDVAPQGPNESGDRYCPQCCRNGMLYESQLTLRPELGIRGMNLMDLLEMFCDWTAASERHNDGCIRKSIEINSKRFHMSPDLLAIFENTVDVLKDGA